jgi:dCTP deaminase
MGVLSDRQIEKLCQGDKPMISPYAEGVKRDGVISYGQTSYGYDVRLGYKFQVFTPAKLTNAVIDPKNFDPEALVHVDLTPAKDGGHKWHTIVVSTTPYAVDYVCEGCSIPKRIFDQGFSPNCPAFDSPANYIIIPPHSFVLGESVETFDIPRDVLVVVVGKSTYARCALVVNVTPGEPEWKGKWTIELSNTAPMPLKVYCGEGIMQTLFFRSDEVTQNVIRVLRNARGGEFDAVVLGEKDCGVSYLDKKGKYQDQAGLTLPTVDKKENQ